MGRKTIIEKKRVYVECTDAYKRVKGRLLSLDDHRMTVEFPTGAVMELTRQGSNKIYSFQAGLLEFISDGKLVI